MRSPPKIHSHWAEEARKKVADYYLSGFQEPLTRAREVKRLLEDNLFCGKQATGVDGNPHIAYFGAQQLWTFLSALLHGSERSIGRFPPLMKVFVPISEKTICFAACALHCALSMYQTDGLRPDQPPNLQVSIYKELQIVFEDTWNLQVRNFPTPFSAFLIADLNSSFLVQTLGFKLLKGIFPEGVAI